MQAVKHYLERGAGTPPQNFKTERLSRAERLRRLPSKGFTRRAPTKAQEVLRFRPPLRTD